MVGNRDLNFLVQVKKYGKTFSSTTKIPKPDV